MATTIPAPPPGFSPIVPTVPTGFVPIEPLANLDVSTGAPNRLRAVAAAYSKPQDKLNLIKKYYPDAQPFGDDNFVFTNPATKRRTLFNPKGLDIGDIYEYGRVVPEIAGGIGGGALGLPAGPAGVVGGGIAGSQVAGELYDAMMRGFGGVDETRTVGEQAQDIGTNVAVDLATFGAGKALRPMLTPVSRFLGLGGRTGQDVARSAQELGMSQMPAGAVGGKTTQVLEGALSQTLGGAGVVSKTYDQATKELGDVIQRVSGAATGATPQSAGQMILDAANDFQARFRTRSGELYDQVGQMMPKGQIFDAPDTASMLQELRGAGFDSQALADAMQDKQSIKILEALFSPEGKVSYNDIKRVRTRIGDALKDKPAFGTLDRTSADLNRIYGALSRDMNNAAQSVGGEVADAANLAARFFRVGMETIENKINPLVTQGGKLLDPEKVYQRVVGGTRRQLETTESQLRQFVEPGTRRAIGATQLAQMAGESASPAKIVSGLEAARRGTGRLPETLQRVPGIESIETVSRGLREGASRANFSNTAGTLGAMSLFGGLGGMLTGDFSGALVGLAAQFGIPYAFSQALRVPAIRQILTDTTTDTMRKYAALTSLGLNAPLAQAFVEQSYSGGGGLMDMVGGAK